MSGVRFTAWLSERERRALQQVAIQNRMSANMVVRLCVRAGLKLDKEDREMLRLLHVTTETADESEDEVNA